VRGDRESKGNHLKFSKEVRRRQKSCVEVCVIDEKKSQLVL